MAGIYIHIPFCKQACHYCDFHFSTSLKKKPALVEALKKELILSKNAIPGPIKTIYFGGGTPSLLSTEELAGIFDTVFSNFNVDPEAEITLEANPDDLSARKINQLSKSPINRLSIGVQSFFEDDLRWMNRSHNATQALESLKAARDKFDNISMDLIYGVPGMSNEKWKKNLKITLDLGIPHISAYALTVEPNTVLQKMIQRGKTQAVDDKSAKNHYELLTRILKKEGYVNYEFSNFGKPGYFSKNNTAYWMGEPYLGIGPSAHGFDGTHRRWNIRNNTLYIKAINDDKRPQEIEKLTPSDRYNEYVMTRLRTMWGISTDEIQGKFGDKYRLHFEKEAVRLFEEGLLERRQNHIHISPKAKFLGDGISADLFYV